MRRQEPKLTRVFNIILSEEVQEDGKLLWNFEATQSYHNEDEEVTKAEWVYGYESESTVEIFADFSQFLEGK